jgi:hypothetical protein
MLRTSLSNSKIARRVRRGVILIKFGFGQGQVFEPLRIVEFRQALQGFLLGVRQDGQSLALCDRHALLWRSQILI